MVCRHSTGFCSLQTCQRQVCGAASSERVLPADALAAHEHPHLRPLHATNHSLGLSMRFREASQQSVKRAVSRAVTRGVGRVVSRGVNTPVRNLSVQDYCIRPGTSRRCNGAVTELSGGLSRLDYTLYDPARLPCKEQCRHCPNGSSGSMHLTATGKSRHCPQEQHCSRGVRLACCSWGSAAQSPGTSWSGCGSSGCGCCHCWPGSAACGAPYWPG